MRAIIKRVSSAGLTIKCDLVASIEKGLCVLVGFHKDDTTADLDYVVNKILGSKMFSADGVESDRTVVEEGLEILCVSQPTFFAVIKGNRLEYPDAMSDEKSEAFFTKLIAALRLKYGGKKIKEGAYGEYMELHVENDGVATLMLDSRDE